MYVQISGCPCNVIDGESPTKNFLNIFLKTPICQFEELLITEKTFFALSGDFPSYQTFLVEIRIKIYLLLLS